MSPTARARRNFPHTSKCAESWFLRFSDETAHKPTRKRQKKVWNVNFGSLQRDKFGNYDPESHCPYSGEYKDVNIVENEDILIEILVSCRDQF